MMIYIKALIFILLGLSFIGFFYYIRKKNLFKNKLKEAYQALDAASAERIRSAKKNSMMQDDIEQTTINRILEKPAKTFIYSGLGHKFPGLTFEIWFLGQIIGAAILYFIVYAVLKSAAAGCAAAGLFIALLKIMEMLLAAGNYKSVEENLIKFLNLLGSYSITAGELTSVFRQISRFLPDPLGYVLEEFYYDAQISGNMQSALYYMSDKIENPAFKDIIRNIEICADYSADYKEIVNSSRKIIQDEQKAKKERKSIANEYILNMLIVSVMLAVSFAILGNLLQTSILDIILHTAAGKACTAAAAAIYIYFFIGVFHSEK